MNDVLTSILESLKASDVEGAKKKIETLAQSVRTERDRGALMAVSGILASISKGKEGKLQTWNQEKIARAAGTIRKSQMSDDWDRGYADILNGYAKLLKKEE